MLGLVLINGLQYALKVRSCRFGRDTKGWGEGLELGLGLGSGIRVRG